MFKKRRRRNDWLRRRNFIKNREKKQKHRRLRKGPYKHHTIPVPVDFSFITNRDAVLKFIGDVKQLGYKDYTAITLNFSLVENISNGAITTLLSVTGWLNDQGITVIGNYPNKQEARNFLQRSGFLDYFIVKRKMNKSNNAILCKGFEHTEPEKTALEVRKAMKTIKGQSIRNTKLQGMLIELMANTINHAYKKYQKGWYLSLDHLVEDKMVKFCFVDNGKGILETIKVKFADRIFNKIGNLSNGDILNRAFDGEYGSRTKLSYRGKGLPVIKRNFEQNYINNLKVISNNVYLDFETGEIEILNYPFDGTFYYWEIDETCN